MTTSQTIPRIICTDAVLTTELTHWLVDHSQSAEVIHEASDCSNAPLCRWLKEPPAGLEGHVQLALLDAVEILARTRHAFRSKDLAELRKRLEGLLKQLSACDE
ncbi:hypothetical protein [Pseudomonas sp. 5P_3.1_Bac2]|uniref:hypothetical protein n=1 Tax=Pseudomonas sp. 5P_3.1_Bac2 TaxID=2971617 RepID=UPI0021CAD668|nr:hypothetical protein [Pseudomonas sp. 5P_3.1_Bac2]MCU1718617.1 hypothetical protein [Pseudomonas sp. 5P_3.1_Bac2]